MIRASSSPPSIPSLKFIPTRKQRVEPTIFIDSVASKINDPGLAFTIGELHCLCSTGFARHPVINTSLIVKLTNFDFTYDLGAGKIS